MFKSFQKLKNAYNNYSIDSDYNSAKNEIRKAKEVSHRISAIDMDTAEYYQESKKILDGTIVKTKRSIQKVKEELNNPRGAWNKL